MNITTKYEINDLVTHKYHNVKNSAGCFEVLEIHTNVCYGGTQVFYKCRGLGYQTTKSFEDLNLGNWIAKENKSPLENISENLGEIEKVVNRITNILASESPKQNETSFTFREDELKPIPKEIEEKIKSFL